MELAKFSELHKHHLESDHVTEAGLSFVEGHPKLEFLKVEGKSISKDVRDRLRKRLPNCMIEPDDT